MPELPDITVYRESLQRFIGGRKLNRVRVRAPHLVRSVSPELETVEGKTVEAIQRLGKQVVWLLEDDLALVFHLMIAGRFHWRTKPTLPRRKVDLASFDFDHGTLLLTEASSKKRASLHVVAGHSALGEFDRGALDVLHASEEEFRAVLQRGNHTLKRALTDPRLFDGIGNAYSDEILHAARLSPLQRTANLNDEEVTCLFVAVQQVLNAWIERLREATGDRFPEKVTAFRPEMSVHGKYGEPCPECGAPVQRVVYAENEMNYCPTCQTGGRLLADRSLSRLLKDDWPSTVAELEAGGPPTSEP